MYSAPALPDRPHIPEALWCLAGTIALERAVLWVSPWEELPHWAICAAAAALALGGIASWRKRMRTIFSCCICCAVGLVSSAVSAGNIKAGKALIETTAASHLEFVVAADPSKGEYGYRVRAEAFLDGGRIGDVWLQGTDLLERGSRVSCIGRVKPLEDDAYGRQSAAQGVLATVRIVRIMETSPPAGIEGAIQGLRESVLEEFGAGDASPERALVIGSVLGYSAPLQEAGLSDLFSECGVSHLVAVSGGHLAVVSAGLGAILSHSKMKPRSRLFLLAALSGLFVLFCGMPLSAVRAWLMSMCALGAVTFGRRAYALSSVACVALILAWADPCVTSEIGFLLSVYAVAGLCLFGPYISYLLGMLLPELPWIRAVPAPAMRRACSAWQAMQGLLAATLACQLVTAALVLETFGTLSLVAPLANILVSAPFSVLIASGMLAACLAAVPALAAPALMAADAAAHLAISLLGPIAQLPLASISLSGISAAGELALLAALALWIVWWPSVPRRALRWGCGAAAAVLAAILISWRWLAPARLVVLDVGQGDAILVQEGGSAVLVDTGPAGSLAAPLQREHILHLDAVVLTHLHDDHTGGLADLAGVATVDRVLVAEGVAEAMPESLSEEIWELTGQAPEEIAEGTVLSAGGFTLRMVWPKEPVQGDENGDSIEFVLEYGHNGRTLRALLTGDGEEDELAQIAEGVGDIDVLKVGHHGSEISITAEEAAILRPELAVASAGEGNEYGHPRQECIDAVESAGALFLCTMDVGSVTILPGTDGATVYTERPIGQNG